jgi:nucleotide-binding universal stress UspA family protein
MAAGLGVKVTVLHVSELKGGEQATQPVSAVAWELKAVEAETYLEGVTARLHEVGLDVESRRLEGQAAEQIVEYGHQQGIDLMVLSSHGQSGLTGWNVSSVVQKIIARGRVSTMIVRAYQPTVADLKGVTYSKLMCPLDCSQRAEHVLPVAAALARAHHAQVLLAHVVRPPEMPHRRPHIEEERALIDRITEINRVEAERCLEHVRSSMVAEQAEARSRVLISDDPAQTLHDLVKQENIDLVLMSAHGYSGVTRWPYGSLAWNFILYGSTPLLLAQDLAREQIEATDAEIRARELTGH